MRFLRNLQHLLFALLVSSQESSLMFLANSKSVLKWNASPFGIANGAGG